MEIWALNAPPDPEQTEFTADDFNKTYVRDTLEATKTLQILNIDPIEYTSTLDWIETTGFPITEQLGPKIYILSKAGRDITQAVNTVLSFRNQDGAYGGAAGYPSDILDTALALQALKVVNYSDQNIISSAINHLLSAQNTDGGFGFCSATSAGCSDGSSNVYMTALVSSTLQQFQQTTSIATAINKATSYLIAHQNADGGFGEGGVNPAPTTTTSTVYETALAYMALVGVITDNTVLGGAVNYLTSTQLTDGSWDQDPYSTALALRALYISENLPAPPPPPPPAPTTGTITGKVADASTNLVLSGVSVTAISIQPSVTTTTDATGSFSLADIPQGTQTIAFSLSGYGSASATVNVTAGSIIDIGVVYLSLNPTTGVIKGTVTDSANGQPLSSVTITVSGSFTGSTTTGSDGTFMIANVTPGTVSLSATKAGYYSVSGTGTVPAGGRLLFNPQMIALPPPPTTGTVIGKVVDATTGGPVSGIAVEVLSGDAWGETDAAGNFTLSNVTSGSQIIFFAQAGYTDIAMSINVIGNTINNIGTISILPYVITGVIKGMVIDTLTYQPVSGVTVTISGPSTGSFITGADGNYIFTNVNPGNVTITATKPGYATVSGTVFIVACEIFTADIWMNPTSPQTGTIKGTATDAANNQPLEGVIITITGSYNGSAVTGADGTFIIANVTPGFVTITVTKTGYNPLTGGIEIPAGGTFLVNPKMTAAVTTGNLTGRVYDGATNMPIPGATVYLSGGPSASTDSQGVFLINNVTPDTYQTTISASGYLSKSYLVSIVSGMTLNIQTISLISSSQSSTVTGKISDASTGRPLAGAEITVVETGFSTKADFTGAYTLTGIPLLEFNIKASAPGYDSKATSLNTSSYGTFTADFSLSQSQMSNLRITSLTTDKNDYSVNENVIVDVTIENAGATEINGLVSAEIQDSDGNIIAIMSPTEPHITLAPSGNVQTTMQWNTGQFPPGDYIIRIKVTDPFVTGYPNSQGALLAEMATFISITPASALSGAIALSPPVTQANMQEPIAITAAIRNTGNIPITTILRLEATFNGNVVYTTDVSIIDLPMNNIQEYDFGSFVPQDGGNYAITLKPTDTSIASNITANLYVGDYATATFTVTPDKAVIGDAHVTGAINLKGVASASGTVQDPLVPLMKAAIQYGVNWEQSKAVDWQVGKGCFGCHVQTQTLIGMELSRDKVTVDDSKAEFILNFMATCQKQSGFVTHYPSDTSEGTPIETTTLYAWSIAQYHDATKIQGYLTKALDYLLTRQNASGYWVSDYYYGSNDWWSDLGQNNPTTPFTAYNVIALTKAYQLTGLQKYKDSMLKAVSYLSGADHTKSIITAAHIIIGLKTALPQIDDQALKTSVQTKIDTSLAYLKSKQNADGGWGRYAGNSSDPLPAAHVVYAMSLAGLQSADQNLRNGTIYLLNKQNADGTWSTIYNRANTIPDRYFSATTWAIISLPLALDTIGGINADLTVTLPQNIILDNASIAPSKITQAQTGATYLWDFRGLTDDGKELLLNLTFLGLQLGEERKAASDVYLSFEDTYTGKIVNLPIEIPVVTGISPVAIYVETDKEVYNANEPVNVTTTVTNFSPELRNPIAEITIEDMDGNVVDDIENFQIDNLNPSYAAPFLYGWNKRVKLSLDHTKVDSGLSDFPVRVHLGSASGISRSDLTNIFNELKFSINPSDDFETATLDTAKWTTRGNVSIQSGKVMIDSSHMESALNGTYQFKGDFDIQIDFSDNLSSGYEGAEFGVSWDGYYAFIKNTQLEGYLSALYYGSQLLGSNQTGSAKYSLSGSLRMVRQGNTVINYYRDGASWIELFRYTTPSAGAASLNIYVWRGQGYSASAKFDNFKVNAGEVVSNVNRKKIALTTPDGQTQCYAEIERWDAANKEADLWIKVPSVSSTEDSALYLYYDADHADNTLFVGDIGSSPARNVWDSHYKAVYHLAQDPSGSAPQIKESTSNANHGLSKGSMTYSELVDAKVGQGLSFDGSNDRIDIYDSNSLDFTNGLTIETNVKMLTNYSGSNIWKNILSKGADSGQNRLWQMQIYDPGGKEFYGMVRKSSSDSGAWVGAYFNWTINTWYRVTLTYDKAVGKLKFFKDGSQLGSTVSHSENLVTSSKSASLGNGWWAGSWVDYSNVVLDEVRFSDIARSDAWLRADYNSINDNLITFGSPESANDVDPAATRTYNFTWNTGSTPAGDYLVRARLYENGVFLTEDTANFTILPDKTLNSKVVTDKVSYQANSNATLTSTTTSASANYIFENLTAKITINMDSPIGSGNDGFGQQSANSLYEETKTIPLLIPGQMAEFKTYWNTAKNPPGTYPVTLEITDSSGTVLSTTSTTLTISSEIDPSSLLRGQINVDKQVILRGEPENISYSITNVGNIDLSQVDLSILTVHVVELTPYDTLIDQISLLMGGTYSNTQQLDTQNYSAKDYLVILRATISGVEETLAGTYFRVEGAPSEPSINSPQQGTDVETLTPLLIVNNASDPNNDKLTYEFEIYSDGGLSNITASGSISEGIGATSWTLPFALTENATYYWRARAYDGILYGDWMSPASFRVNVANDSPTVPTLSAPADNSEVSTLTPALTVNNASDPDSVNLTYNFDLSLDSNFTQIVVSEIGVFEGEGTTSWPIPLALNENTTYYWRAQADDWLITGPWMTTAQFFVNTANDAPTAPIIISPSNGSEITTLYADIISSNSTDPDSAQLTCIFEIDTVNTFDSTVSNGGDCFGTSSLAMTSEGTSACCVRKSGTVPCGGMNQATLSWTVNDLCDNTLYYIRAKASDGLAESPWSETINFFVNTANDAPTTPILTNPSNGGAVNVFTPTLSVYNSADIDRDALTYEFELYGDSALTNLIASAANVAETIDITSWTVPVSLTENKTYYWRARAYDGELYSDWMPLAFFMVNTANDAPSAPTLNSPSNGSSLDTLTPTLSVHNAIDPDSDSLTYDFEIYSGGVLIKSITAMPQGASGITSATPDAPLSDNTTYTWRARAYDGDRYGAWMDMAAFSIHLPVTSITATIDFDPDTLNKKSNGTWVVVYIELPSGYNVADIKIPSLLLNGTIKAETWPYSIGDHDKDGIPDLMVKFKRSDVINLLPNGDKVIVKVTGEIGDSPDSTASPVNPGTVPCATFEGVDVIRVIP